MLQMSKNYEPEEKEAKADYDYIKENLQLKKQLAEIQKLLIINRKMKCLGK